MSGLTAKTDPGVLNAGAGEYYYPHKKSRLKSIPFLFARIVRIVYLYS